jgi:hypothetical protein
MFVIAEGAKCKANDIQVWAVPLGLQMVETPIISRQSTRECSNVVSPKHRPPLPSRIHPGITAEGPR